MDKVRIGDICTVVSGSTPKSNIEEYWNGDIKWITPAEITDDSYVISDTERHITEKAVEKTNLTLLPVGAVLLSSRAPIGKTAIVGAEMYCNQGFKNLICSERIYNKYLYFFLTSKVDYLNALGRGATFKEISKGIVEDVEIPLPSLDEQKKIAERFEAIQQLISKRKQVLLHIDNLVKSRFVEMFGDPLNHLKLGNTVELRNLTSKISVGYVGQAIDAYVENGIPYLRTQNVRVNHIDLNGIIYVSKNFHQRNKKSVVHPGDVLVSRVGVNRGMAAVIPSDLPEANVANCLIIGGSSKYESEYLAHYLNFSYGKSPAFGSSVGSAQGVINTAILRVWQIYCPDIELQRQYVAFIKQTDKSKLAVQQSIETLQTLKAKLMQDYFG